MNLRIGKLRSHGENLRINYMMRKIGIAMNNRNIEAVGISVIRWRMSPPCHMNTICRISCRMSYPYYMGDLKDDMKRTQ